MNASIKTLTLVTACLILNACIPNNNLPLLFGQTQTLGVTINGSTTQQSAELTLGYRDFDIAIVPVSVTQQNGAVTQIKSTATQDFQDALSVLGQFQANAQASTTPQVDLGKFFATGAAAKTLADGFKAKLSLASNQPGPSGQPVQPAPPTPPAQPVQTNP